MNTFSVYLKSKQDFPTPESPMRRILNKRSYWSAISFLISSKKKVYKRSFYWWKKRFFFKSLHSKIFKRKGRCALQPFQSSSILFPLFFNLCSIFKESKLHQREEEEEIEKLEEWEHCEQHCDQIWISCRRYKEYIHQVNRKHCKQGGLDLFQRFKWL